MSDDDILSKADALMQRRRVFVAAPDGLPPAAPPMPIPPVLEDVPVLTDIVDAPTTPAVSLGTADLRKALAREIESWLDEALPRHAEEVLRGVADQVAIQLALKLRAELLPRLQEIVAAAAVDSQPPATGGD